MNPPSLREICAKATNPQPAGPQDARDIFTIRAEALYALHIRLPPATALAVYEALENSERVLRGAALTIEDFSPYKAESATRKVVLEQADQVKAALRLLDGRTEP